MLSPTLMPAAGSSGDVSQRGRPRRSASARRAGTRASPGAARSRPSRAGLGTFAAPTTPTRGRRHRCDDRETVSVRARVELRGGTLSETPSKASRRWPRRSRRRGQRFAVPRHARGARVPQLLGWPSSQRDRGRGREVASVFAPAAAGAAHRERARLLARASAGATVANAGARTPCSRTRRLLAQSSGVSAGNDSPLRRFTPRVASIG